MRTHNTYIFTNKKPVAFARSANKYSSQGVDYHTGRDSNCPVAVKIFISPLHNDSIHTNESQCILSPKNRPKHFSNQTFLMCVCVSHIDTWYLACVLSNYNIYFWKNWKRDQLVVSTRLKNKLVKMGSSSPGIRVNILQAFDKCHHLVLKSKTFWKK